MTLKYQMAPNNPRFVLGFVGVLFFDFFFFFSFLFYRTTQNKECYFLCEDY